MNIFKLSPQKDSRAIAIALVILLIGALLTSFIGCGSDTITNNNNSNTETLQYSLDSFGVYMPNGPAVKDTTFSAAGKTRITFDCTSNTDSISSWALFKITADYIDSNNVLHTYFDSTMNHISKLNNSFNFVIDGGAAYGLSIYIQLVRTPPAECYIRFRNIRIYHIN